MKVNDTNWLPQTKTGSAEFANKTYWLKTKYHIQQTNDLQYTEIKYENCHYMKVT